MAHFDQQPTAPTLSPNESSRNARYGLILFAIYSSFYAAFMLINAFAPQVMETIVFAGINLAVVYGIALIATAFALALVYAWLCRTPVPPETPA